MACYEFQCPVDGVRFEQILPRLPEDERAACPDCGAPSPLVWSLPVMRPDKYWDGYVHPNYGYVTSASQLKAEMKRRNHVPVGDRTDREAWDKIADKAQDAKKEKLAKDVHEWNVKTFGPSGLGLGGADGEKFIRDNS
jgi:hypothetical protein